MVWNGWTVYGICALFIGLYAIYDGNIRYINGSTKDELANLLLKNPLTLFLCTDPKKLDLKI